MPFWNKHIYPPFKADNSNNSFCTLVRHSKLYTVAYMSIVVDYFSNSSTCYSHCYLLFKSTLSPSTKPQSSLAGWSMLRDFVHCGIGPQVVPALWRNYLPNITWMYNSKVVQLPSRATLLTQAMNVHVVRDLCGLIHSHIFNTGSQEEANPLPQRWGLSSFTADPAWG